jgi:hypothetical protein
MDRLAKPSLAAIKVLREVMRELAERESDWKLSPEKREANREARTAIHLKFFANRDEAGNVVYEHTDPRTCHGISPYDPREGTQPANGTSKVKRRAPLNGHTVNAVRLTVDCGSIERLTNAKGDVHWRSISKDNVTTWYGKTSKSRIADPEDPSRIFSWLICQSYDDKGNAIVYDYVDDKDVNIEEALANERNRDRTANRYLKHVKYGNRKPNRFSNWTATDPEGLTDWMFEVVLDYGEGAYVEAKPDNQETIYAHAELNASSNSHWPIRKDPFSIYRAGFEVRTYRLCRRVLMFHHFPEELGIDDCLVRSTDFTYSESPIASFITSVTQSGYVRKPEGEQPDRYLKKSLPP